MLDEAEFWTLLDASHALAGQTPDKDGFLARQADALHKQLVRLCPTDVRRFSMVLEQKRKSATTGKMRRAATLLAGAMTDDFFEYFTSWVVSLGCTAYDLILENPDELSVFAFSPLVEDIFFEELSSIPAAAYEEISGQLPEASPHISPKVSRVICCS